MQGLSQGSGARMDRVGRRGDESVRVCAAAHDGELGVSEAHQLIELHQALRRAGMRPQCARQTLGLSEPPKRQGGIKVGSVEELVDKLKNEARVI